MSDNLSFSKQGAATQADKPAHGMGNASTKAQLDEAAELEASEGSNDADNTEADTARATTGKAAAVSAVLWQYLFLIAISFVLYHLPPVITGTISYCIGARPGSSTISV